MIALEACHIQNYLNIGINLNRGEVKASLNIADLVRNHLRSSFDHRKPSRSLTLTPDVHVEVYFCKQRFNSSPVKGIKKYTSLSKMA